LDLIDSHGFGVSVSTKSDLVTRDIDLLSAIKGHSPTLVKIAVTAADDELCGKVEPHASPTSRRLAALQQVAEQGIFAGLLLMPVLPFIEDSDENVLSIVRLAHQHGAGFIYPMFGVTLRQNQREWYCAKLDERFPGVKMKYVRQYGNAYECVSPRAKQLWRFQC
jgi:DNA repair photolyase